MIPYLLWKVKVFFVKEVLPNRFFYVIMKQK